MLPFLLSLASCFPAYESIYRPEAPDGKLIETMCHYNSGPGRWDGIEFVYGKVKAQVRAIINHDTKSKEDIGIRLSILIPEGSRAQFLSDKFIFLVEGGLPQILEHGDIHSSSHMKQNFGSIMTGGSVGRWNAPKPFWISLTAQQAQRTPFFLELPDLLVDGETFHFPKIYFTPEVATYFAPINC
jgi:hypothetical protein